MPSHGLTTDGVIALTNDELVQRTWDAVDEVAEGDNALSDDLAFLVGELIERLRPRPPAPKPSGSTAPRNRGSRRRVARPGHHPPSTRATAPRPPAATASHTRRTQGCGRPALRSRPV